MTTRIVRFPNDRGIELAARLDLPPVGRPRAYALFAHCFTCSKNLKAAVTISRALTEMGLAVLRFDFTGIGESGGAFEQTGFGSNVADIVSAARYLQEHLAPVQLLVGHSLGGAAVLKAAGKLETAKAVVTIGAPASPDHVKRLLAEKQEEIREKGSATVTLAGRRFRIGKVFLDDLDQADLQRDIGAMGKALLVCHAPTDNVVGIENAARIFQAARHPKSFLSLDGADHLLTDPEDCRYLARTIAAWADRYLEPQEAAAKAGDDHDVRVRVRTGAEGYESRIDAGGHHMVADEPRSLGGTDKGPTPYHFLAAALGACTSITLRMYADRKKWPLESITVDVHHQKVDAAQCDGCKTEAGKVDRFVREIRLDGPLDNEQLQRLQQIADRCPVHRSLHSEIVVDTRLMKSAE